MELAYSTNLSKETLEGILSAGLTLALAKVSKSRGVVDALEVFIADIHLLITHANEVRHALETTDRYAIKNQMVVWEKLCRIISMISKSDQLDGLWRTGKLSPLGSTEVMAQFTALKQLLTKTYDARKGRSLATAFIDFNRAHNRTKFIEDCRKIHASLVKLLQPLAKEQRNVAVVLSELKKPNGALIGITKTITMGR